MLIFRYLAKEVFVTLTSLTTILVLIFMSNQFVRYLNRAASGQIPLTIIMKLMMLELPNLMALLLPLGFYVALLVAYGRLYAESEMTVLQACGYGPSRLLKHSYIMAIFVGALVMVLMLWASPLIAIERTKLIRTTGVQTVIQTIIPGRFRAVAQGREIFYIESMNRNHQKAKNIFLAKLSIKNNLPHWDVLWANQAFAKTDEDSHEDYLILNKGNEYEGQPGESDYRIVNFEQYQARLPHPTLELKQDVRSIETKNLWPLNNPDKRKAAELQWRFSIPLMVLTLTLVAVPLSRVNPRSGKFAKLLPAIILYIIYANFMFVARDWMIDGKIPVTIGIWWIHIVVLLIGLALIWRNWLKLG
ncbi:LPS export ABC transporter permease LptF [Legionella gresilensis]|uniref:LPS export ABC transporter permease LptF n=1 Tax=Legionella gresilensis TaxID=91823 RepID=UPI001040F816|nr:LPS export ABC transporter permease LptF [Legionella gresilensis]